MSILYSALCHLKIKTGLFFNDLKFKSELLKTNENYNNIELKVPKAPLHERIQLRIVTDKESSLSEVRF